MKMNNISAEEAVERVSKKLERQTGKGLSFKEKQNYLRLVHTVNPYKKSYK